MIYRRRFLTFFPFFLLAIAMFALILANLSQADPLQKFPSLDSGYYLYIGQQILKTKIPYIDLWESKPPGIFYINAFALWLARGSRWGIWLAEFAFMLSAAFVGFWGLHRRYGFFPAVFGSLAWLWGIQGVLQGGNLTEEYALPFNFLAILLLILALEKPEKRIYPFLIGVTFAFSFLLRANNTATQVAIVFAWAAHALLQRQYAMFVFRMLWSGLGVLIPMGFVALLLIVQGNFWEMIEAAILFNLSLTGGGADFFASLSAGIGFIGIPAGFALLGYLLLVILSPWRETWHFFLLVLFPLEIVSSGLSGRGYPHYYILWMPILALCVAHLFSELSSLVAALERKRSWASSGILLIVLLFSYPLFSETAASLKQIATNRQQGIEIDSPISAYLREHTQPNETVLVWGGRLAYNFQSRRESPSSILFYPLLVESELSSQLADRFLSDVLANPPVLIVDTHALNQDLLPALDPDIRAGQQKTGKLWQTLPANIDRFYEFVARNYSRETEVDGSFIYRINVP